MTLKHVLKIFSKTEVQEDKTHPCHLSQTILNRLFGRVLKREGVKVSCAERTEKHLFSYSPIHLFTFKKAAFTLAEVLITLAIIGVVAALTLPTLIQNHQKRSLEVATQKFYSTMSQAIRQYMADQGVDDLRNTALASDNYEDCESPEAIASIRNFVTKYLKVVEECDHDANNCFAPKYKAWDGSDGYSSDFAYETNWHLRRDYVLADGSIIRIGYHISESPIDLFVDINGKKGPNRVGYDLWSMSIFYDGVIDEGMVIPEVRRGEWWRTPQEQRQVRFEDVCQNGGYGGCFGHFLENNFKFDY